MKIPNLPNDKLVQVNGEIHPNWKSFFEQLINVQQYHLSDEGYILPRQQTENITKLENASTNNPNNPRPQDNQTGRVIYNSETQKSMINNSGNYQNVATEPLELTTAQRNAVPSSERNNIWVQDTDLNKLYFGLGSTWKEVTLT
jgi:hypothetical protein